MDSKRVALFSLLVLLSFGMEFLTFGMGSFAFYGFVVAFFSFLLGGVAFLFGVGYLGFCVVRAYPSILGMAEMTVDVVNSTRFDGLPVWFVVEFMVFEVFMLFYFEYFVMRRLIVKKRLLLRLGCFGLS